MSAAPGCRRGAAASGALLAAAALLVAGCTAAPDDAPVRASVPSRDPSAYPSYEEDPTEIADLRAAAGLAACPDLVAGTDRAADSARERRLPDLTLPCLGTGPAVNLADLGGVPYVVNVWAAWCGPCKDEMPYLEEVYQQTEGRVGVLGVDFEDTAFAGLSAAADFGVTFPSVQDTDGRTRSALRFPGPPFTVFVAADGAVVATKTGVLTSADELRDLIHTHLGVEL